MLYKHTEAEKKKKDLPNIAYRVNPWLCYKIIFTPLPVTTEYNDKCKHWVLEA